MVATKTASTEDVGTLTISPPNFKVIELPVRGTTPLVMHKFSAKARAKIAATQEQGDKAKSRKKRDPRDFETDYIDAMHVAVDGWLGIPASAFRQAMIAACRVAGFVMTRAKLAIFVLEDGRDSDGTSMVKITKGIAVPHDSYVRNETGVVDLRRRPMFHEWEAIVRIKFDADMLSATDVVNLLDRAGQQVGILEGRPGSHGSTGCGWGTFEVVRSADAE
jgi:hypothetical protein